VGRVKSLTGERQVDSKTWAREGWKEKALCDNPYVHVAEQQLAEFHCIPLPYPDAEMLLLNYHFQNPEKMIIV